MKSYISIMAPGLSEARAASQNTARALPGTTARALNETAKNARAEMIRAATERYAMSEAGARHLNDLKQTERASAAHLAARLDIKKMRSDLGYFETRPNVPLPGNAWRQAPRAGYAGHVLRTSAMHAFSGGTHPTYGNVSKGFLARFKSGHVGMVQRVIGSSSRHTTTARGAPRWRNKAGKVEKLVTIGAPSAAAAVNTVWPERERVAVEEFFVSLSRIMEERR